MPIIYVISYVKKVQGEIILIREKGVMFLVCLECFDVVEERPPFDDSGVVPVICPNCRERGDRVRQMLDIQSKENLRPHKALFAGIKGEKKASIAE